MRSSMGKLWDSWELFVLVGLLNLTGCPPPLRGIWRTGTSRRRRTVKLRWNFSGRFLLSSRTVYSEEDLRRRSFHFVCIEKPANQKTWETKNWGFWPWSAFVYLGRIPSSEIYAITNRVSVATNERRRVLLNTSVKCPQMTACSTSKTDWLTDAVRQNGWRSRFTNATENKTSEFQNYHLPLRYVKTLAYALSHLSGYFMTMTLHNQARSVLRADRVASHFETLEM